MTDLKRYCLALVAMIATWTVLGFLGELITPLFAPTTIHESEAEMEAWASSVFVGLNIVHGIQTIAAFGVGAFLIGKRVLIAGWSLSILKDIAKPALPSITYLDILSQNPVGWIGGFVCVVIGVVLGEHLSRKRAESADAL